MVNPSSALSNAMGSFESDVIPDSGKSVHDEVHGVIPFESDVIPDSGKSLPGAVGMMRWFESDVIPDSGKSGVK